MPRKAVKELRGKTWQDFAEMSTQDFNALSVPVRQAIVDKLGHVANTRYNRFLRSDTITPAVRELQQSGGRITAADKTEKGLATEFARAKRFITRKTSTRSGWSETKHNIIKSLADNGIKIKSMKQFDEFWKLYNELAEEDSALEDKKTRYRVMKELADAVRRKPKKGETEDERTERILTAMRNRLSDIYKERIDAMNDPRIKPVI